MKKNVENMVNSRSAAFSTYWNPCTW